jgi:hypothetical protein
MKIVKTATASVISLRSRLASPSEIRVRKMPMPSSVRVDRKRPPEAGAAMAENAPKPKPLSPVKAKEPA